LSDPLGVVGNRYSAAEPARRQCRLPGVEA